MDLSRALDITAPLRAETLVYPGDPPFERRIVTAYDEPPGFETSALSLSAHAGTHLDAPAHLFPEGRRVSDIPLAELLFEARVVAVAGDTVSAAAVDLAAPRPGEALLFRTRNSERGLVVGGRWEDDWVALTADAARRCVELGVALVGLDGPSVDRPGDGGYPAHRALLGADRLVLENCALDAIAPGAYRLLCLPLPIEGGEAAPVRALLLAGA